MASLTAATRPRRSYAGKRMRAYPIANAEVVYQGGFYAISAAGFLTEPTATAGVVPVGYLSHFGQGCHDAAGKIPSSVTGNTSPAAGSAVPHAVVDEGGFILHQVPVTGASAQANVDDAVFLTTDNLVADLTIAPVANARKVGRIDRFISAILFDVEIFDKEVIRASESEYEEMDVKTFTTEVLEATSAIDIETQTAEFRFAFISLHSAPQGFDADYAAGSQVLSLEIAGTPVTGGLLTLTAAQIDAITDVPVQTDATAITALNVVPAGATWKLKMAASGTAFTAVGDEAKAFRVYAKIMRL